MMDCRAIDERAVVLTGWGRSTTVIDEQQGLRSCGDLHFLFFWKKDPALPAYIVNEKRERCIRHRAILANSAFLME
jgi:hypothetical protein